MKHIDFRLDREDIILLLFDANERLLGKKYFNGITRLEKIIFLLQNETDIVESKELFRFKAYNYGPFSKEVYEAADFLEGCELILINEKAYPSHLASVEENELVSEINETDDDSWEADSSINEQLFSLTENGKKLANVLKKTIGDVNPDYLKQIDGLIRRFGSLPLYQLIRYVYRRYPDMTEKSIHPEANRLATT